MAPKVIENAQKVVYLIKQYPKHTIPQIIELLQLPAIEINTALWAAQELGYITEPTKKLGKVKLLKTPVKWELGESAMQIKYMLLFSFEKLAESGIDLEENYLSNWTQGYLAHDVLIAICQLKEEKKLAEYAIEDGDSTYIFFTLYKNKNKQWGRSQFKKDPLPDDDVIKNS